MVVLFAALYFSGFLVSDGWLLAVLLNFSEPNLLQRPQQTWTTLAYGASFERLFGILGCMHLFCRRPRHLQVWMIFQATLHRKTREATLPAQDILRYLNRLKQDEVQTDDICGHITYNTIYLRADSTNILKMSYRSYTYCAYPKWIVLHELGRTWRYYFQISFRDGTAIQGSTVKGEIPDWNRLILHNHPAVDRLWNQTGCCTYFTCWLPFYFGWMDVKWCQLAFMKRT